ncbi:ferredoxin [Dietzia aurantiaca]|uniref:Ferredoxin n=1 Tax=Dietzia aurantiaca TaxID=983873 RepID=A0ABV9PMN0_9ACTN
MKRINIDTSKCSGHGRCYTVSPDFFDPDDEGFPVLLVQDVDPDSDGYQSVLDAVDNCPERAITLTDAE